MNEQDLLAWIEGQAAVLEERLIAWSNINSGSENTEGLRQMANQIAQDYEPYLGRFESIPLGNKTGLQLVLNPGRPFGILLSGHFDTVFGLEHPFQDAQKLDADRIQGPGVADMKGGLLVLLTALAAVMRTSVASSVSWVVLMNPDEEIGSFESMPWILNQAKACDLAFVFEPSITPAGDLVSTRKGSGKFKIVAKGRAAHAGRDFSAGRNAIVGLSRLIEKIDALNGQREGLTINIGKINGGTALNIVPDEAFLQLDIRTSSTEDQSWVQQALEALVDRLQGYREIQYELSGRFGRPPKLLTPATQLLMSVVEECAGFLNQTIHWKPSGGCCDGNNLAAAGLTVIDSLGVRGDFIHTSDEYMLISSLVERAQLTAMILMRVLNDSTLQQRLKK